jgi:heme-degrading monooxygenase HmoA
MTMSAGISQSAFDGSRLRVILLLDLYEGAQEQFLAAYEHMRNKVASVPGHISDQLCQSIENPSQWLITSEWESALPFLAWVNQPLTPEAAKAGLQKAARVGAGVTRHALTFTVKPGSESKVVDILANYDAPEARINGVTRLHRTSLFMHGNRVVRAVEVEGDLLATLCHVASQPEVQAVEEAINPYLEQDRDLSDSDSARVFFTRAALPAMQHVMTGRPEPARLRRHMLYYPALADRGLELARFLAHQDEAAANDPDSPVYASTVFQRDDVVVRMIDVTGELDLDPAAALGVKAPGRAAELERLLDGAAIGVEGSLDSERNLNRLLAHADMMPVTDRSSAHS